MLTSPPRALMATTAAEEATIKVICDNANVSIERQPGGALTVTTRAAGAPASKASLHLQPASPAGEPSPREAQLQAEVGLESVFLRRTHTQTRL